MAVFEIINRGTAPNDGTGDEAREAFRKTNDNFANAANLTEDNTFTADVGIGAAPTTTLDVTSTNASPIRAYRNATNASLWIENSADSVYFGVNASSEACIGHSADLSAASLRLSTTGQLDVLGVYNETTASAANVFVASDGSLQRSTSSKKIKKDISEDINPDLILDVKPVKFKEKKSNKEHYGFIAEQVGAVDKRFATNLDEELPGLDTNALLAMAVAKIQELENRILELEK